MTSDDLWPLVDAPDADRLRDEAPAAANQKLFDRYPDCHTKLRTDWTVRQRRLQAGWSALECLKRKTSILWGRPSLEPTYLASTETGKLSPEAAAYIEAGPIVEQRLYEFLHKYLKTRNQAAAHRIETRLADYRQKP